MKLIDYFKIDITPKFTKEDLQPLLTIEEVKPKIKEYRLELLNENNFVIGPPLTINEDSMNKARQRAIFINNCRSLETRATSAFIKEVGSNIPKEWIVF